jgi:Zn-dependent alcohol dehydrogenase
MNAARILKVNEPLQVQELQTPKPKGSQGLIKIQYSGVVIAMSMCGRATMKDTCNGFRC